ncbi:uncharacterized protein LOC132204341 [Neocloeon triangulifer]|uniref:uncharacterized protein LOC132204341 n=1 Tax=Neocloeon triangulifer TaxID=2078957 RepID=UPI00286F2595|nr:uncharacterized protein LOC132204341 [Neocloeon triangulifer]
MLSDWVVRGLLVVLLGVWVAGQGYVPPVCEVIASCKCRFPWGSGFDLSNSTVQNFTLPSSNGTKTIFFNPCPPPPGTNNTCPQNAAICSLSDGKFEILGLHANVTFGKTSPPPVPANFTGKKKPGGMNYVQYLYTDDDNNTITTTVIMTCAYAAPTPTLQEDPTEPGRFILSSKGGCFTKVELPADEVGLSAGATFLIIFFSLFAAYFIGGMAIMKFIKGAQGVEVIPNYEFWTGLPSLVKDGFLFAISGCRGSPSYDRI